MIDVRLLRTDPDAVRRGLERRHAPEVLAQLDRATELDAQVRSIQARRDSLRAEVNEVSKQVVSIL